MSLTCNMNGIDKVGWSYLLQALAMSEQMELFEVPPATTSREMRVARANTAWAVFCWQAYASFFLLSFSLSRSSFLTQRSLSTLGV
ncbi:hypothetical protein VFPPC_17911 [Pochonia chlamydosporia 170]|uniref:Uncharacterized protein n=1 Tax=Pochonia chlamydosporia 170 TaxID=1380566 RepID=A0A219AQ14_METCM|nr:hypothetical protein VFPPC_17911 [Pochonia chlamydosporia 170]OWT42896.1 hypothetical protein VFPPC_17911 [Pochonia chlamydosporia 170]